MVKTLCIWKMVAKVNESTFYRIFKQTNTMCWHLQVFFNLGHIYIVLNYQSGFHFVLKILRIQIYMMTKDLEYNIFQKWSLFYFLKIVLNAGLY